MPKIRTWFKGILEFTYAHLAILLIVVVTLALLVVLLGIGFGVEYSVFYTILNAISVFLGIIMTIAVLYNKYVRKQYLKSLKQEFHGVVQARLENWLPRISRFYKISREALSEIIRSVSLHFFKRYEATEQIDRGFEEEIDDKILEKIQAHLKFSNSLKMYFEYDFITRFRPFKVQSFFDRLNKQKISIDGTDESEFFKMFYLLNKNPKLSLKKLQSKVIEVKISDIVSFVNQFVILPSVVEKLKTFVKDKRRYDNLVKVVNRCVLQGYISSQGLISLLDNASDIFCVIKFEGGLSQLQNVFSRDNPTPFKKVLLDYGFVQPSKYAYFTFMLPANKVPEKYRTNIDLFMKEEIIPKVEKKWRRLKARYSTIDRIRHGPDYKYMAFIIKRAHLKWDNLKQRFGTEFERKILGELDKEKAINLLISQTHNIPQILRKMEADSLIDSGTDRMKEAIRLRDAQIRANLRKLGYEIQDITDFRKLKDDRAGLARTLLRNGNIYLRRRPRVRKINQQISEKMAEEIITNSSALFDLIENLGVKL